MKAIVYHNYGSPDVLHCEDVVFFVASIRTDHLIVMKELIEANDAIPVIDRRFTLNEVPEAIRYLKEGHAPGKVVIAIA